MLNTLKKKINAAFISITIIFIVVLTALSAYELRQIAEGQMKSDGETIVSVVEHNISKYSISKDLDKITKELKSMKDNSGKDIVYISVMDTNYKIIAHDDDSMVGSSGNKDQFGKVLNEGKIDGFMYKRTTGDIVYNVSIPLTENDKIVGAVSVGLSLENMKQVSNKGLMLILFISLIILSLALCIAMIISHNITKPLIVIKNRMARLAEGDFTIEFHSKSNDEIGQLMNTLNIVVTQVRETMKKLKNSIEHLDSMSQNLSAASEELASSGEEISNSILGVSESTMKQNDHTERMNDTLEHFAKTLDLINEKLGNVSNSSKKIKKSADVGSMELKELTNSVDDIRKEFANTEERIISLNENVSKISEITDVINAVAEQTNLLALNAAIEAARAGESGRGFSIVAEEIRKLAEQVLESSKSITNLINTVTSNTENVSNMTEEVSNRMQNQVKSVKGTVESFEDILSEIETIFPQVENVYEALNSLVEKKNNILEGSELITRLSEEIASSSQEISSAIQQQTATTEELSASAQQLTNTADQLNDELTKFKV